MIFHKIYCTFLQKITKKIVKNEYKSINFSFLILKIFPIPVQKAMSN